jgi:hypothetical protein
MKSIAIVKNKSLCLRDIEICLFFKENDFKIIHVYGFNDFRKPKGKLGILLTPLYKLFYVVYFSLKIISVSDIFILDQMFGSKWLAFQLGSLFRKKVHIDFYVSEYDVRINDRGSLLVDSRDAIILKLQEIEILKNAYVVFFLSEVDRNHIYETLGYGDDFTDNHLILPLVYSSTSNLKPFKDLSQGLDGLRLVWWGSFNKIHGLEFILSSLSIFKNTGGQNFTFDIFGVKYEKGKKYEKIARDLGIYERCSFNYNATFDNGLLEKHLLRNRYHLSFGLFGSMKKSSSVISNKLVESLYYRIAHVNINSPAIRDFENLEDAIYQVSREPQLLAEFLTQFQNDLLEEPGKITKRILIGSKVFNDNFSIKAFHKTLLRNYENLQCNNS